MRTLAEAQKLWDTMGLRDWAIRAADDVVGKMASVWARYEQVEVETGVPAYFTACIHYRETSVSFSRHLANGDLLEKNGQKLATVRVPQGLGPFDSWEDAAVGALRFIKLDKEKDWTIASSLLRFQRYNGMGYVFRKMETPYVWSGSIHYEKGKYKADGVFDFQLVDKQVGCAVLLDSMRRHGIELGV